MRFLSLLLVFLVLSTNVSGAAPRLREPDLLGGYLIAREVGGHHIIEARLKKIQGRSGLRIVSLREGSLQDPPRQTCVGWVDLEENQIQFFFECGDEQYGSRANLPAGQLNLRRGIRIRINNREYLVRKESRPVFRNRN